MRSYTLLPWLLPVLVIFAFCSQTVPGPAKSPSSIASTALRDTVQLHSYDTLTIPLFFEALLRNHWKDMSRTHGRILNTVCEEHSIEKSDTTNMKVFYSINLLHELFTSSSAMNGSRGTVLNIPYLWHWVDPNPRHQIVRLTDNLALRSVKPPKDYGKYATYADIDRTPYLFISEMLSLEPLYSHPDCGSFNTFGWCSEREMAYSCLAEMLGYDARVIASGNHSWSELKVKMNTKTGRQDFIVRIDNTFDQVNWTNDSEKVKGWSTTTGDSPMAKWYNDKAHAETEMQKLRGSKVKPEAAAVIENALVTYLNSY